MYYIPILLHNNFTVLMNLCKRFTVNDTILDFLSIYRQLNVFLRTFLLPRFSRNWLTTIHKLFIYLICISKHSTMHCNKGHHTEKSVVSCAYLMLLFNTLNTYRILLTITMHYIYKRSKNVFRTSIIKACWILFGCASSRL